MTIELQPIRRIIETARIHPAGALPTETHQSFPVPVSGDVPTIAFLFAPSVLQRGVGLQLLPPSYRAMIRGRDAHFEELRAVSPADFGLGDDPSRVLGTYGLAADMTPEAYTTIKERLLTTYDTLLPWFYGGDEPTASVCRVALDFQGAFELVGERVLRPYYRALGRRFFAWVDAVAR